MKSPWTPERIATLERFWADGWSCGDIAKRIGLSRNAVIGRVNRMGLSGRRMVARPIKKPPALKYPKPAPASASEILERKRDERDLRILDRMAMGLKARTVAPIFGVTAAYVDDLWATRRAQNSVGEV